MQLVKSGSQLLFPPFRLDLDNACLWREEQIIPVRRTPFALLRYLAEHSNRLVTKEELLSAVWPDTCVSEAVLKGYVQQLRKVLGDNAQTPRFIETVHGWGYRFLPSVTTQPVSSAKFQVPSSPPYPAPSTQHPAPTLIGREAELAQLHDWLGKAMHGERQIVFVTGEPGIGKTTLVEAFLEQAATKADLWATRGQCIEHYGAGEAFLPVLDALNRLCREPGTERLITLLSQYAPSWLIQLPWLLSPAEQEELQRRLHGAPRERMLREMAEALEALTVEHGLILWLEDLQWSDPSTVDLLSFLAQRQEPARLLLISTYRPADVIGNGHPLYSVKQELQIHRHCEELPLGLLTEEDVTEYLAKRLAGGAHPFFQRLAQRIHQRTEGNPLFMVNIVDYLVIQGVTGERNEDGKFWEGWEEVERGVPATLQQMIEKYITQLSPEEQRVLEAASVAGREFSAAAVAGGLEEQVVHVECLCTGLARRSQFLQGSSVSEWPDGTIVAQYTFLHTLYQQVLYKRLPVGRRVQLHRRIGEREEAAYGDRAREIAAELARHFEQGRDYQRAVRHLQQAAENATRRYGYGEAISHLTKALDLLKTWPTTQEHIQQEIGLQLALGARLMAAKGYTAADVERVFARAWELCQQGGESAHVFYALSGLASFALARGELHKARNLGQQALRLARNLGDPALIVSAHVILGESLLFLGELTAARACFEEGLSYHPKQEHPPPVMQDPWIACLTYYAWTLWFLGYPDQALERIREALTLAQELSHPHALAQVLICSAAIHAARGEARTAQQLAKAGITLAHEHGFPFWLTAGTVMQGWTLIKQGHRKEGIAQMRRGLAAVRVIRLASGKSVALGFLAEAYGKEGQAEEGLGMIAEALAVMEQSGERLYEALLYRIKGELTLQQQSKVQNLKSEVLSTQHLTPSTQTEAEACFLKAIEIARRQSAKILELQATMSLSRLWQQQGKKKQARQLLAEIYHWFTEGFDTADLQEARRLLGNLARSCRL